MTMPAPGTAPAPVPWLAVVPAPGSRLEQLLAMKAAAERAAEDAVRELKMIKDGIKAEAAAIAAGQLPPGIPLPPVIPIEGAVPLVQRWKVSRTVNGQRLKQDHPDLWEKYAEYGKGYWELRAP